MIESEIKPEIKSQEKRAMACLVETAPQIVQQSHEKGELEKQCFENVKYNERDFSKQNPNYFYGGGLGTISSIDTDNKKSEGHFNCLSLVGLGDGNGESFSFMAHVNSRLGNSVETDPEGSQYFMTKLKECLLRLKEKSTHGNIEICLLGGDKEDSGRTWSYSKTVEVLNQAVRETLGQDLIIMDAQYTSVTRKDVYVENNTRRIYQITEEKNNY